MILSLFYPTLASSEGSSTFYTQCVYPIVALAFNFGITNGGWRRFHGKIVLYPEPI